MENADFWFRFNTPIDKEVVTPDDVIAYLEAYEHDLDLGMEIDLYFKPEDLNDFATLQAWWPKGPPFPLWWPKKITGLPEYLQDPNLKTAMRPHLPSSKMHHKTFAEQMKVMWSHMCEWLLDNRIDPIAPNETKEQRSARLAQARYERTLVPHDRRFANKSEEELELETKLDKADLAWRRAIKDRNEAMAEYDSRVAEERMEVRRLKARLSDVKRARLNNARKAGEQSDA